MRPVGTRDALVEELKAKGLPVEACTELPDALRVTDGSRAIFESRWMKEGRLQVMDLGSQLLAAFCEAKPGQTVVDYCAGAGGKTLVLADAVTPTGRVFAWDSSEKRLKEARNRVGELKLRHVSFPSPPRIDLAELVFDRRALQRHRHPGPRAGSEVEALAKADRRAHRHPEGHPGRRGQAAEAGRASSCTAPARCCVKRTKAVVEQFLVTHPGFTLEASLRVWPHRLEGGGFFGARLLKS